MKLKIITRQKLFILGVIDMAPADLVLTRCADVYYIPLPVLDEVSHELALVTGEVLGAF